MDCENYLSPMDEEGGSSRRNSDRPECKLDSEGHLTLFDILSSLNGPLKTEQAWAVCHQAAKYLSTCSKDNYPQVTSLDNILLHKEGDIRLVSSDSPDQPISEREAVLTLGVIMFEALDFGVEEQEEQPLSPDLAGLMTAMTHSEDLDTCTDDEGIEKDSGELDEPVTRAKAEELSPLANILQACERHIQGNEEQASTHYRAVIRALVAEALEFSQFIEQVAFKKEETQWRSPMISADDSAIHNNMALRKLGFHDWARFWVQVIGEMRRGVQLKKVEADLERRGSVRTKNKGKEFELTPYEILMSEIRERKYRLRKAPAAPSNVRKDARAVILDFIKSRPTLKKASERKLAPLEKQSTIHELLMESIRKPPKPLRSMKPRVHTTLLEEELPYGEGKAQDGPQCATRSRLTHQESEYSALRQPKKLIPVDFDLKLDDEDDEGDEDYDEDFETRFDDGHPDDDEDSANPWRKTGGLRLTKNEYHRFCDAQLESYDLATQCPSRRASVRKHSHSSHRSAAHTCLSSLATGGATSLPHSRPESRQNVRAGGPNSSAGQSPNISLNPSPRISPQPRGKPTTKLRKIDKDNEENVDSNNESPSTASLGEMLLDERLSLTLEEIVHIRSVLTKAELESLPVEGRVKEDVEKRRVCFLCLRTRFGILGPWGQRCRLCARTVCVKCYSKMRIPTGHFAHVPVVLLSPGLLLSPSSSSELDSNNKSSWLRPAEGIGSAPASPASKRKNSLSKNTPVTTPTTTTTTESTTTTPSHLRRFESIEKRFPKTTGSPAKLASTATFGTLSAMNSEQQLAAERLRGVAMVVCHDCRIMVLQIIKSSRSTRATIRNNVISRLTLNLSPAYV